MTTNPMLGWTIGNVEIVVTLLVVLWIGSIAQCIMRRQYIWLIIVLLAFIIGTIAYWLFGRLSRDASA
jgi:hypothetical protein